MAARRIAKALPHIEHDKAIQRDCARIAMIVAHIGRDEGDERHPEEEIVVGPEKAGIGMAGGVQKMVMIDPHDGDHQKAEQIGEELGRDAAQRDVSVVSRGTFSSSTMMVMMTAMTPSLKASMRFVPMDVNHYQSAAGARSGFRSQATGDRIRRSQVTESHVAAVKTSDRRP